MSTAKNIFSASIWGIIAKVVSAMAKFVTIPMLVAYYGKNDYGLIALAFSLNAYLRLMDMGLNIGAIRFFSMWLTKGEIDKVKKISQSSIVFYGVIGFINAAVFLFLAFNYSFFFKLQPQQVPIYQQMMYILAISAIFDWTSNVISQLLSGYGEMEFLNKVTLIASVFDFICAWAAVVLHQPLILYYTLYIISTLIVIPLQLYQLSKHGIPLMQLLFPRWHGAAFKEIIAYSINIFIMAIFQFSADNLRPLLLGKYSHGGLSALTDYRVVQTISSLVMMFGSVFIQVLLPHMSKLNAENDTENIEKLIYGGTKYISIFLSFIIFLLVANSRTVLTLYMGNSYSDMSLWLSIWLITLLGMHISPVSSLILSSGKTKPIAYMAAVSCVVSLTLTGVLASRLNVGAAVIGYLAYTVMQNCFNYFYYLKRILNLNGRRIFLHSFAPAVLIGVCGYAIVYFEQKFVSIHKHFVQLVFDSSVFSVVFIVLALSFLIKPKEILELTSKFLKAKTSTT